MKKIAVMQPYLFPYLGYFQVMKAVDQYVIYDGAQFVKRGWINRNNILLEGRRHLVTIPLAGASQNKQINQLEFKEEFTKFQRTLAHAYARAPHKETVLKIVADICAYPNKRVHCFIRHSFEVITDYLGIGTEFIYSSEVQTNASLRSQDKILTLCAELGATTYVNAIGGQTLYSKEAFRERGIELYFLKSELVPYQQLGQEFVPWLSIIDVLMFNSVKVTNRLLNRYELI